MSRPPKVVLRVESVVPRPGRRVGESLTQPEVTDTPAPPGTTTARTPRPSPGPGSGSRPSRTGLSGRRRLGAPRGRGRGAVSVHGVPGAVRSCVGAPSEVGPEAARRVRRRMRRGAVLREVLTLRRGPVDDIEDGLGARPADLSRTEGGGPGETPGKGGE